MSRLLKKMNDYVIVNGREGLAQKIGKTTWTIGRYLNGGSIPPVKIRYRIALACGCTHEEALELAQELPEAKGRAG